MNQAVVSAAIFLGCALMGTGCSELAASKTEINAEQSVSESPIKPTDSPMVVENCSARTYSEAEEVIRGQIMEFNFGRFKKARAYASIQFREAVTLKDFRTIIEEDYSFLLESPEISFKTCIERQNAIYIQVALTVQKVTVLDYRLIRDEDGLGIDAALITARSVELDA
jgi:hypothetical protein